jgi:hypothetical protein
MPTAAPAAIVLRPSWRTRWICYSVELGYDAVSWCAETFHLAVLVPADRAPNSLTIGSGSLRRMSRRSGAKGRRTV